VSEDRYESEELRFSPPSSNFSQVDVKILTLCISDPIRGHPTLPVGLERSCVFVKKELKWLDDGKMKVFPANRHDRRHRFRDGL